MISAAYSDIGIEKQTNQDSYCVLSAETPKGEVIFLAIADGMGGLEKGEMASGAVIQCFADHFVQDVSSIETNDDLTEIQRRWSKRIQQLNFKIRNYGKSLNLQLGTTLTAMLLVQNSYLIMHIGDCRIYQIRDQQIHQLTQDQTFIAYQIAQGNMTEQEASADPRRNMLLQCIGVNPVVEPEFIKGEILREDLYLMCSDGFRHQLSDQEILTASLSSECNEEGYCKTLIYLTELVKTRKENDNITAMFVKI